jgi:hypothetical protein
MFQEPQHSMKSGKIHNLLPEKSWEITEKFSHPLVASKGASFETAMTSPLLTPSVAWSGRSQLMQRWVFYVRNRQKAIAKWFSMHKISFEYPRPLLKKACSGPNITQRFNTMGLYVIIIPTNPGIPC